MSDDLAQFLLARIAEDEEAARGAWPGPWETVHQGVQTVALDERKGFSDFDLHVPIAHVSMTVGKYQAEMRNAAHIARWDPARVLAECAVKKAIVEMHQKRGVVHYPWRYTPDDGFDVPACGACGEQGSTCTTLRLLAQPYADHEGFREEWKVQ